MVDRMRRDIDLRPSDQREGGGQSATLAFALSFRGRNPEKVALVANTLASQYIEENLKVRERQAAGTADFLKGQLAVVKRRLDEQERLVSDFKKRYLGELPQQLDANLATIERLDAQLRANGDSQTRATERREALLRQFADASSPLGPRGPDSAEDRLAKMNEELRQLRANYSEKYPDVVRLKGEIAALEREIAGGAASLRRRTKPPAAVQSPYVAPDEAGDRRDRRRDRDPEERGEAGAQRDRLRISVASRTSPGGSRNSRRCRATTRRPASSTRRS